MTIDWRLALASFGIGIVVVLAVAPVLWMMVCRQHGFPAIAGRQRQPADAAVGKRSP